MKPIRCHDRTCGAEDCPSCHPENFHHGRYVRDDNDKNAPEAEDICGLCGEPGADKIPHPIHWPGERVPDGPLVHAQCESDECARAHSLLSDKFRRDFLRNL
jgi:hypothetical protein